MKIQAKHLNFCLFLPAQTAATATATRLFGTSARESSSPHRVHAHWRLPLNTADPCAYYYIFCGSDLLPSEFCVSLLWAARPVALPFLAMRVTYAVRERLAIKSTTFYVPVERNLTVKKVKPGYARNVAAHQKEEVITVIPLWAHLRKVVTQMLHFAQKRFLSTMKLCLTVRSLLIFLSK